MEQVSKADITSEDWKYFTRAVDYLLMIAFREQLKENLINDALGEEDWIWYKSRFLEFVHKHCEGGATP